MKTDNVDSICVFGSAARSSSDLISDRDVLVVADDPERRQHVVRCWRAAGWSVAAYSPTRLMKMIGTGSLFLQHLKLEGIILRDQDEWLARVLHAAGRKQSYEEDALRSVELALPIERFRPWALIGQMPIVADLAYVALRNYGICHLADRDEIVFDFHEIVKRLADEFGLCRREVRLAHSLRATKARYRGGFGGNGTFGTVEDLRLLLSKFFEHRPLEELPHNAPVRDLGSGYATLRDFEAAVVRKLEDSGMTWDRLLSGLGRVWKMIRDPRIYAWEVRNLSPVELESLRWEVDSSLDTEAASRTPWDLQIGNTELGRINPAISMALFDGKHDRLESRCVGRRHCNMAWCHDRSADF